MQARPTHVSASGRPRGGAGICARRRARNNLIRSLVAGRARDWRFSAAALAGGADFHVFAVISRLRVMLRFVSGRTNRSLVWTAICDYGDVP